MSDNDQHNRGNDAAEAEVRTDPQESTRPQTDSKEAAPARNETDAVDAVDVPQQEETPEQTDVAEHADSPGQSDGAVRLRTVEEDTDIIKLPEGIQLPEDYVIKENDVIVALRQFEGPLDLLLFLIRKHRMDIFDIPMADITARFFDYILMMQNLNIDIAADFIVMASTLIYIKSRMLLPSQQDEDDDGEELGDPRQELVRRLLEYQKYADAAKRLEEQPWLGREVFVRDTYDDVTKGDEAVLFEVSPQDLLHAFEQVLERISSQQSHEVEMDEVPVDNMIRRLAQRLKVKHSFPLSEMFGALKTRGEVVALFLALLEFTHRGGAAIFQHDMGGEIFIEAKLDGADLDRILPSTVDDYE